MRLITFSILAIIGMLNCIAQSNALEPDTIKVIDNPQSVSITKDGNTTTLTVHGYGENNNYNYEYKTEVEDKAQNGANALESFLNFDFNKRLSSDKRRVVFETPGGVYGGVILPTDNDGTLGTGWEYGVQDLGNMRVNLIPDHLSLNFGLGMFSRFYSFKKDTRITALAGRVYTGSYDENVSKQSSRIYTFGFQMPVMFYQHTNSLTLGVGAVAMLNTYTNATCKYVLNGESIKEEYKSLHQRPVTIDLIGLIGIERYIGAYVRYSPMSTFRDGFGPKFKTISVGIILGF